MPAPLQPSDTATASRLRRELRLQQIHSRLIELHDLLEPDLTLARHGGQSLTEWRTAARLRRNEAMAAELRAETSRAVVRRLATSTHTQRTALLAAYLRKVVQGAGRE